MKSFILRSTVIITVTSIFIIGIAYSQKYLYRILSSDYDRHAIIIDVLTDKSTPENLIVFGDSRAMFDVDTRIIKDVLKFNGEVYNLSSVGQGLYESSYFYGILKSNTKAVIQCVSPSFFSDNDRHHLSEDKAISMFLSGYRISDETKSLIVNYNRFFDQPPLKSYIESRSYFKSYIHNLIRPIFDNEQFDESVRNSLYFPHIYTTNRHPNYPVYKYDCDIFRSKEIPDSQLSFLLDVRDYFNKKGITFTLVLMPVSPDECNECYDDFKMYQRIIEEKTKIKVINLSDFILDTKYFYDAGHANKDGAKIISMEIAEQLLN